VCDVGGNYFQIVRQKNTKKPRRRRRVPVELEVITTVLEPADAACEHCGKLGNKIGDRYWPQAKRLARSA